MKEKRTVQDIERTIREMDQQYDANFGDWVQSEENIDVVAFNFKRYIERYDAETFAEVLRWITNMWSTSYRVSLLKKLFLPDLFPLSQQDPQKKSCESMPKKKVLILRHLIAHWAAIEISELIIEFIPELSDKDKKDFLLSLLESIDHQRLAEVFIRTDSIVDWSLRLSIIKKGKSAVLNQAK